MTITIKSIAHTQRSFGRHTDVSYTDESGHPLAARLAGWWAESAVVAFILNCRKNDRNK